MTRDEIEKALDTHPDVRWWDTGVRELDDGELELRYLVSLDPRRVRSGILHESWTTDEVVAWIES